MRRCSLGYTEEDFDETYRIRQEKAAQGYMSPCEDENSYVCGNMLFVNAYLVDRAYGGPEEGGWYYDTEHPLASVPVPAKPEKDRNGNYRLVPTKPRLVEWWRNQMKALFSCQQSKRGRSSVIGGPDVEVYVEECPARRSPETRPHYE